MKTKTPITRYRDSNGERQKINYNINITRDKNVNLKRLKKLERAGLITIHEVQIEEIPKSAKNKILPVLVFGHTEWGECSFAGEKCNYPKILDIIGKENIKDAIHLEAHIRNGYDYFVTEDKGDFINNKKREKLQHEFNNLEIVTLDELENILK